MSNDLNCPPQEPDLTRTLNKAAMASGIAIADALEAYMEAAGTTQEVRRAVLALRDAGDFAHQAAIELACADAVWAPEAGLQYRGAVWKFLEFARMLPPKSRAISKRWLGTLGETPSRRKGKSKGPKRSVPNQDQ